MVSINNRAFHKLIFFFFHKLYLTNINYNQLYRSDGQVVSGTYCSDGQVVSGTDCSDGQVVSGTDCSVNGASSKLTRDT